MADVAGVEAGAVRRARRILDWARWRWPLRALVVAAVVASVAARPVRADERAFLADLVAGHVSWYSIVATGETRGLGALGLPDHATSKPDEVRRDVIWVADSGLMYRAGLAAPAPGGADTGQQSVDVGRSIAATARAAGQVSPPVHQGLFTREWVSRLLSGAVGLVLLLWFLTAPQPRRFTRWGWFWLLFVGLTAAAVLVFTEAPFDRRMNQIPEPAPGQTGMTGGGGKRRGGGTGLLVALVVSALLTSLVDDVGSLVARRTTGRGHLVWHVVTVDGNRLMVEGLALINSDVPRVAA